MFGFFASQESKMRENSANWLELAEKVYHFRRDVLPAAEVEELQSQASGLRTLLKERAGAEKLKIAIERLEDVLRRTGGAIYPKSALVENVEFFLVAAIVILGIRTYFVQPFKIPTNSMWPTYNGMTPEVWHKPEEAPGLAMQAVRFVLFGAQRKEVVAPESGSVTIPVYRRLTGAGGVVPYDTVPARNWLVLPTTNREYTLYVNETAVKVRVPADFNFDWALRDTLGLSSDQLADLADQSRRQPSNFSWVTLPIRAERGKPILSFDIITGDQLFVDRMSYHFVRPQVGQGFVFRTGNIPDIARSYGDQYYIKRLVGGPGDRMEIREPVLYRNGQPNTGADAFSLNARRAEKYRGYFYAPDPPRGQYLFKGETVTVPANHYMGLGDNSADSADGRYWGFVPAKDVVGRPLFVYFPFTRHWGPAR